MKLQKATAFALFAVLELAAEPQQQLSAVELAQKYRVSAHHLAKVLRDLAEAGILEATRGVGGGYRFVANAKRLTLFDVIEVFEPVGSRAELAGVPASRTEIARALRFVFDEVDELAEATFRSITISTMLKLTARRSA